MITRKRKWNVTITNKAAKKAAKKARSLPIPALNALRLIWREMESEGPFRTEWPGFGKLKGKPSHWHCHLKKGKPTFVLCWRVYEFSTREKEQRNLNGEIEIYYAWTHESAPY